MAAAGAKVQCGKIIAALALQEFDGHRVPDCLRVLHAESLHQTGAVVTEAFALATIEHDPV